MRIGELTQKSGVPATALRYYEQAGLLPAPRRTPAGYRVYDADALPRVRFIRAAQAVGLSLADVGQILQIRDDGAAPCRHVLTLVERRRAEVADRIRELRRLERNSPNSPDKGKFSTRPSATRPEFAASSPSKRAPPECLRRQRWLPLTGR